MKQKKWLLFSISIVLLIGLGISTICFNEYKEEQRKKEEHLRLVENTKKKYNYFKNNKIQKNNDKNQLNQFFNSILIEEKKDDQINFDHYISSNLKIDTLISNEFMERLEQEINNYNPSIYDDFTLDNLKKKIDNSVDKETVINIYKSNSYIKELNKKKENREDYLNKLKELKDYVAYFKQHKNNLIIRDNSIIYKDDSLKEKLEEFKKKYNLDISVKKEETKTVNHSLKSINGIPILCYHGILDTPWGQSSLFVKVQEFDAQMKYLSEQGYTTLFTSEIANAKNVDKPIIITFDDGYKDVYTNAFPILKKYNLKANVYMISGWINGDVYMTNDMTKEMASSPLIEIGSHTVNHKVLATLSDEEIEYELKESKASLEQLLNTNIDVIAYPTGSYDNRVLNLTSKYYKYGLSTNKGKEDPNHLNTYKLNRIYVYRSYNIEQFKNLF